jgi:RNA polymerase sigma-70 factor, ECF subfamily
MSDAELLQLHVEGDPDAFGELFLRHKDRLWAVAIRTLSDPEDAADALQDAMISAFRRADSFRGESAVTTWLHRIVVNACLDRMRRRSARPEVSGGGERQLDLAASTNARPDHAAGSETSIDVMAALRQLPHDQQVAIVLVDMLEYPVSDAAKLLGVAEGTVKSRCARGRARLLPKLAHLRRTADAGLTDAAQGKHAPIGRHARPAGSAADPASRGNPARAADPVGPKDATGPANTANPAGPVGPVPPVGPITPAAGRGFDGLADPADPAGPGETQPGRPGTTGQSGAPRTGQSGSHGSAEASVDAESHERNRFAPGSVLPAQKGGDNPE